MDGVDLARSAPMLADIRRQPAVLAGLAERRQEFLAAGRTLPAEGLLIAFGCGDGWFAARTVAASGGLARRIVASTSLGVLLDSTLPPVGAIAISMSGSVDCTNAAARAVRSAGGRCLALSDGDGGALGRIADAVASLHVSEIAPFLTGTARYTASVLGLMMALQGAAGEAAAPDDGLTRLSAEIMPSAIEAMERDCSALCRLLAEQRVTGLRVLGAGAAWASADYGAAKLVKLVDIPVWSGEIEEFAHSQFWSMDAAELVLLLAVDAVSAQLAQNTAAALASCGIRSVAVVTRPFEVPAATHSLVLPACPASLLPLLLPVPLQLFAYHLALATGRDPNIRQDAGDAARFRAAQLLSRRAELGLSG